MSRRTENAVALTIMGLLALALCGCSRAQCSAPQQTDDRTGLTWFEPVKGAK